MLDSKACILFSDIPANCSCGSMSNAYSKHTPPSESHTCVSLDNDQRNCMLDSKRYLYSNIAPRETCNLKLPPIATRTCLCDSHNVKHYKRPPSAQVRHLQVLVNDFGHSMRDSKTWSNTALRQNCSCSSSKFRHFNPLVNDQWHSLCDSKTKSCCSWKANSLLKHKQLLIKARGIPSSIHNKKAKGKATLFLDRLAARHLLP